MRRVVGREGRMDQRASMGAGRRGLGVEHRVAQRADRRPRAPHHRGGARARRGGRGRPRPQDGADHRGPAGEGRVPSHRHHREHDGGPALGVRGRGHARGARGGHRREARRPGRGEGRVGHVARPDGVGERDGVEPDRSGAEHLLRGAGGGPGRPVAEDHGGGQGRGGGAGRHDERHDRHAGDLCRPGDERGARGGHRRQARGSGRGAERGGDVEGPDGLGEPDGVEPHRSGAQHRRGDDGGGQRRPVPEDHRGREGRDPGAQGDDQHDGRPALGVRGRGHARGARGGYRGHPRRPGRGGRRRQARGGI